ncbi:outer membrane transport energization protein TonB [Octadecabacter temperatus]|uniref:Gram-negative bacterial tonB protein n=1 Tax=Octadecabacter temperatus TaxID=1458307 RepID=A0A0K0Y5Z5_9RHOB|nr:TonB family protein [Octadecabacter temperatus]AKS46345.1 Gram-negative bacterial tonB protein [Octadecabacter temperatus]SIO12284.1 outer membrane transport energization protein TonB [Octadecabacter temperatus]
MNVRASVVAFLAVSAVAHGALVWAMALPENAPSAAGPPPALTAQGNSFADMVQGVEASEPDTSAPSEITDQADASPTPLPTPTATTAEVETADAGLQLQPEELSEMLADVAAVPEAAIASVAPAPVVAVQPTEIARVQPQVIEALPDVVVNDVTSNTVRPPRRPANLGQTPPPPPPRQTQQARQTPAAPQGNSNQDTRRGTQTTAPPTAQATPSGQGQQVDQAAVAAARQAAANYGNVVMRRISRTRRENTRSRGVAVVSFRVGASGQLASVGIGQSSGDAELDRIAVNHVRRAAPFPAPPSGAQTSFSIQFQGR